ncbi:prepilin peptidase [Nitrososphaera viennensis]|uniref:Prepilin peptidase n=1 Tax=Nitrososphaera viennensis TaxID=1034015 RepID=A0A977IG40_9ARCH|nr:A24 family peptidase [Nitrososphaera viennensis]UVS70106.1 prepilin peptidase [Nitrososphaera viennensis]
MLSILFVREILCLAMLSIGSYYDLKTREVNDRLWMVFGGAGLVLYAWEYASGVTADVQMILVSVSLTAAIAIALYRYGFFGGADAKALVAVSVILPVYHLLMSSFYVHPLTGITVLTNAVLFALVVPLYNALSNLIKVARGERIFEGFDEPTWKKILACFVGTPSSRPIRHHLVIECSAGEGKKRFSFRLNCDEDDSDSKGSCCAESSVGGRTWLSQNLPFLVFILAGFLVTMLFGDMLLLMLQHQ